jgi:predicted Rossmann fold nucleotide-binding protein DprA/Smf involved in DNA uptake
MMPALSPNTQTILLLTAPLIAGRGTSTSELLSPGEYKKLARHLREVQKQPSDLIAEGAEELLRSCQPIVDATRIKRLLERGFLLGQVVERWQARAIWVVSRADAEYPRRLKVRLKEDAPPVLYGCGDINQLELGGLSVVGSRNVTEDLIDYTMQVGHLAARAGRMLVSGGAKGVDQAAMRGAIESGGLVCGVLADSLEKTIMNRENRNLLLDGQLVLTSPFDPSAGFNVGNAMQRNKLIYALSDAALIVNSDLNKGGTWAGAVEQIEKFQFVPVYVRSTGVASSGLDALHAKGARLWPNPTNAVELDQVFNEVPNSLVDSTQADLALATDEETITESNSAEEIATEQVTSVVSTLNDSTTPEQATASPAERLIQTIKEVIPQLLTTPMKDGDVATALNVTTAQAKAWLQMLLNEGLIEKKKKPAGYVVKQTSLFE